MHLKYVFKRVCRVFENSFCPRADFYHCHRRSSSRCHDRKTEIKEENRKGKPMDLLFVLSHQYSRLNYSGGTGGWNENRREIPPHSRWRGINKTEFFQDTFLRNLFEKLKMTKIYIINCVKIGLCLYALLLTN